MSKRARNNNNNPEEGPVVLKEGPKEQDRSEVDELFQSPKERDKILSTRELTYHPLNSLETHGPILFSLESTTDEFTDLSRCFLTVKLRVLQRDGLVIEDGPVGEEKMDKGDVFPDVWPVNDFLGNLFKRVSLEINGQEIGPRNSYFGQISVLKNLLSYSQQYAEDSLKDTIIWIPDDDQPKKTAQLRFKTIKGSRWLTLKGHLSLDAFNSRTLLPPFNSIRLKLDRAPPEYCLMRDEHVNKDYKIQIASASLSIRRVKLKPGPHDSIVSKINKTTPYYLPFSRFDARAFDISSGSRTYRASVLYSGQLPARGLLVFNKPQAFSGTYDSNPSIFPAASFKISKVKFFIDEVEVLPAPYTPEWEDGNYVNEYMKLMEVAEVGKEGCGVSYPRFKQDYGIFAVNLRGFQGKETGNISVEVWLEETLDYPITGLLVCQYNSCLRIFGKDIDQIDY